MPWLTPDAYHEAIQNPQSCFYDPELKRGQVAYDALGLPLVQSGQFASVYKLSVGGRHWAVRCFLHPATDQRERYDRISQHLRDVSLQPLVGFEYQEQGIRVQGQTYPIVKMEWVEGVSLSRYIADNLNNQTALLDLAKKWRGVISSLRGSHMAHGDLQHGNVLVTPQGHIELVDYDDMFVPSLLGKINPELGHRNYQHPLRTASDNDERLDNFSALLIYLSLRALIADPILWQTYHTGENLILTHGDLKAPDQSPVFSRLQSSPDPAVILLAQALKRACSGGSLQTPEFESAVVAALTAVPQPPPQTLSPTPAQQSVGTIGVPPLPLRRRSRFPAVLMAIVIIGLSGTAVYKWKGINNLTSSPPKSSNNEDSRAITNPSSNSEVTEQANRNKQVPPSAASQNGSSTPLPPSSSPPLDTTIDGIYVDGLRLTTGMPLEKVRAKFGIEDERYGKPNRISYSWNLKDGSHLTTDFDSIGSLLGITISVNESKQVNSKTFAMLEGIRVVPGQTTLSTLRQKCPDGQLGNES